MTYEVLQLRDNQILDVLLAARKEGITTMIHAENGDVSFINLVCCLYSYPYVVFRHGRAASLIHD